MRISFVLLMSFVLAMPLATFARSNDDGRTYRLTCDSERGALARAIERARDGDTIRVRGTCTETLTIDKEITLDGGGAASLSPESSSDSTITVDARNVTIRGFLLESPAAIQIALIEGATASVESNTIRNASSFGISVTGNSFLVLLGNRITDNRSGVAATFGAGIRLGVRLFTDDPIPNVIANNAGPGMLGGIGVLIVDNSNASILGGNSISGNNIGVVVAQSGHAQVAGNEITGNQIGIFTNSNGSLLLPFAENPNPLFTALNTGVNAQFGIACRGGFISGVPDGLAPAVRLPPVAGTGILGGPASGLATLCFDATQSSPQLTPVSGG